MLLTVSLYGQSTSPKVFKPLQVPAAAGNAQPNLSVGPDGRVYLTWIEPNAAKGKALRFAVREQNGWSTPRTIAEGSNWFVNWADFPALAALPNGSLLAHYLVKSGPSTYAYDVNVARSTNGGRTWQQPVVPHRDGTKTEHGFVSFFPMPGNAMGLIWLDGRNFKVGGAAHSEHDLSNEMTLRFTTINEKGELGQEALLDTRVCDCCQTSAALTADGPVVVYRDRSEKEIRDISIVRYVEGQWTKPVPVHTDGWQINGCPVNGPAVAAAGRNVAVAWFTVVQSKPRVLVAFSQDSGATFSAPIQVDEQHPVGRVDLVLDQSGHALVSWIERVGEQGELRVRRIQPNGQKHPPLTVAAISTARLSGFPRMERAGNELIFAWTEVGPPSHIRTAVGQLSAVQ